MSINDILKNFSNELCSVIWDKLQKRGIKGIGYTGSYARGDYSSSRPDINFAVFVDEITPKLLFEVGTISSSLNTEYSKSVNLRPEYHPDRFVVPWGRDKTKSDLFFKIAMFELKDMDSPFPFGRPGYVVEGHKLSAKILYGKNYFENTKITSSNELIIKGVKHVLPNWLKQARLASLSYNLENDTDLFFNEAMIWGKLAIQQYAWVQGIKNGLNYSKDADRYQIFDVIHNKKRLRKFFDVEDNEQKMINVVLDSRMNYSEWKSNKNQASDLYLSSCHLLDCFVGQLGS